MENRDFQIGDRVRVIKIPAHIAQEDYPDFIVKNAFQSALGNCYSIEHIDWGGWVQLRLNEDEAIGIQPDCVELVNPSKPST